jgi:hypothetical protein
MQFIRKKVVYKFIKFRHDFFGYKFNHLPHQISLFLLLYAAFFLFTQVFSRKKNNIGSYSDLYRPG